MHQSFELAAGLHSLWYRARPECYHIKNERIETISSPVLALSQPDETNYSHFTVQCLGGYFMALESGLFNNKVKIVVDQSKPFQRELIRLFNIPSEQIITLKNGVLYKIPHMFASTSLFTIFVSPDYVDLYRRAVEHININQSINLYITRRSNAHRPCLNEHEVIDYLKKRSFEIADFDLLPVFAQIALIRAAKIIVAAHGASGANLVYTSLRPFKFIELFGNRRTLSHAILLNAKNCEYSAVANKFVSVSGYPDSPWKVNIELLERALEEPGYKFENLVIPSFSPSEVNSVKNYQQSLFTNEYKLYLSAQDKYIKGDFNSIINYFESNRSECRYKWHSALYHKSCFFAGDLEKFNSLVDYQITTDIHHTWQVIADIDARMMNFDRLVYLKNICHIKKVYNSDRYIDNLLKSMETLKSYQIYTWHLRPFLTPPHTHTYTHIHHHTITSCATRC